MEDYYDDNYLINHFRKINIIRKVIDPYDIEQLSRYDFNLMFHWKIIQSKIYDVYKIRYDLKNWGINELKYSLDWTNNREKYLDDMNWFQWIEKINFEISSRKIKSARIR